jgi:thiol-disulfide isomerase/thioredoxin
MNAKYKFITGMLVILEAVAGIVSCNVPRASPQTSQVTAMPDKEVLPAFPLSGMNENKLDLSDFKGKIVFVNLWASWCGPCRDEMPSIQKLYEKTKGKNVQFVMLALDDDFGKSLAYFKSSKFTLPDYYPAAVLPAVFDVPGIPATFIFNEKGELVKSIEGGDNFDTEEYLRLLTQ